MCIFPNKILRDITIIVFKRDPRVFKLVGLCVNYFSVVDRLRNIRASNCSDIYRSILTNASPRQGNRFCLLSDANKNNLESEVPQCYLFYLRLIFLFVSKMHTLCPSEFLKFFTSLLKNNVKI